MAESGTYGAYRFDFEKLEVYQRALSFTNDLFTESKSFRRDIQFSVGDQFRRAALSICNNLAEGSRKSPKARVQFYNYALDSARECIPMLTLSVMQGEFNSEKQTMFRGRIIHICNMIYRLIQTCR